MPIVLKSESLSLLEPSGPVQAFNGIALAYWRYLMFRRNVVLFSSSSFSFSSSYDYTSSLYSSSSILLLVIRVGPLGFEDEGSTILRNIREEQSSDRMSESCTSYLFLSMVQSTTFSSKRLSYYTGQKDVQRLRS